MNFKNRKKPNVYSTKVQERPKGPSPRRKGRGLKRKRDPTSLEFIPAKKLVQIRGLNH